MLLAHPKSWLHRLWFDKFFTSKIINKENPTEILSLQNTYIKNKKKLKQTIYVHQPLPFTPIKMSLFTDFKMWIYQNVIGKIIKRSINKSNISLPILSAKIKITKSVYTNIELKNTKTYN